VLRGFPGLIQGLQETHTEIASSKQSQGQCVADDYFAKHKISTNASPIIVADVYSSFLLQNCVTI